MSMEADATSDRPRGSSSGGGSSSCSSVCGDVGTSSQAGHRSSRRALELRLAALQDVALVTGHGPPRGSLYYSSQLKELEHKFDELLRECKAGAGKGGESFIPEAETPSSEQTMRRSSYERSRDEVSATTLQAADVGKPPSFMMPQSVGGNTTVGNELFGQHNGWAVPASRRAARTAHSNFAADLQLEEVDDYVSGRAYSTTADETKEELDEFEKRLRRFKR